jgi:hypothetical protein
MNLFAKLCKNKLKQNFYARKYKLNKFIKLKVEDVFKYYGLVFVLNKFYLPTDIVEYISTHIIIKKFKIFYF